MTTKRNLDVRTDRIVFSDGRRGTQTTYLDDDGARKLSEIVVTRTASGERCRHVYGPRSYLADRVYSFADLAPTTWEKEGA